MEKTARLEQILDSAISLGEQMNQILQNNNLTLRELNLLSKQDYTKWKSLLTESDILNKEFALLTKFNHI